VTPGAVSRQVMVLEEFLGARLFERVNREVRLTAVGRRYLDDLNDVFDSIGEATQRAMQGVRDKPLHIWCPMTFAMRWLVPRLPAFHAARAPLRHHAVPELIALPSALPPPDAPACPAMPRGSPAVDDPAMAPPPPPRKSAAHRSSHPAQDDERGALQPVTELRGAQPRPARDRAVARQHRGGGEQAGGDDAEQPGEHPSQSLAPRRPRRPGGAAVRARATTVPTPAVRCGFAERQRGAVSPAQNHCPNRRM
ncbi:MAG: LysR family transcriptional regulator, partial [Sphingomonadales bacterium]|nr:LysR family transcriptional regulator [Sphingomonadales bacterium]